MPTPALLERTLGWFRDERVALVQTPQYFTNVDDADPLGSQAPLFYGPIQQGKDGWNAAFFCGSNAVLRREALMQLGLRTYVTAVQRSVSSALRTAAVGSVSAPSCIRMNASWNGRHDAAPTPFASTSARACSIVTAESEALAAATWEAMR